MAHISLDPGGPRASLMIQLAYEEEGLPCPVIDERVRPTMLMFPRSFVVAADSMPGNKRFDYSFMGSMYRPETLAHRIWVLDFARTRFTERSYLLLSDGDREHTTLGPFDRTGGRPDEVFVPKEVPIADRGFFNPAYFSVLRQSQFSLCPSGDLPWSLRFFEAIMCRSIPIVSDDAHTGRNALERSIGYNVYHHDADHIYDEGLAEDNYRKFLLHQTLIDSEGTG